MKNLTISVDDETYRRARIRAAEEGVSVSALVRGFLQNLVHVSSVAPAESTSAGFSEAERGFHDPFDDRSKLRLMEELWSALTVDDAQYESPSWHKDALDGTAARYEAGDEKPLDWANAKRELAKRAG